MGLENIQETIKLYSESIFKFSRDYFILTVVLFFFVSHRSVIE